MRRRLFPLIIGTALLTAGVSCRSNSDLIEAELRAKDRQLRELRAELARAETMNHAYANTLQSQRGGSCPAPSAVPPAVTEIQLGRGTGGIDEDRCAGDEGLMVVVVPKDCEGHEVKAPGTLCVTALEVLPGGVKQPLSSWDVPPERLRSSWRSGFLSTGYFVELPWKAVPSSERLRVVARFTSIDGVVYEAEKDVNLRTPAGPPRPPVPYAVPGPPTALPMPSAVIDVAGPPLPRP